MLYPAELRVRTPRGEAASLAARAGGCKRVPDSFLRAGVGGSDGTA